MCKKLLALCVCAAVVGAVWNKARVTAATEQVRDAWLASQDQQKLENWDAHMTRQIRALRAQVDTLERAAKADSLAAEVGQVRAERLGRDLDQAKVVVAEFKARAESGTAFSVAGRAFSPELAGVQLARFASELGTLEQGVQTANAVVESRRSAAEQNRAQATALRERIAGFEEKARTLSARRQLLAAQAELRRIEGERSACACDPRPIEEIEGLFRLAESELDRIEAEQRLSEKAAPARTLSLDETLERKVKY